MAPVQSLTGPTARPRFPRSAWLVIAMGVIGLLQAWLVLGPANGRFRADIAVAGLLKPLPEGEWWRLLTAPLLHGSLLHFAMNGLAFVALAQWLERLTPRWWVGVVWLGGALGGGLASAFWNEQPSVGASGGIVAMMGFVWMLGWRWQDPGLRRGTQQALLLTLGLGLAMPDLIDNAAHLGGLLVGAALGFGYATRVMARVARGERIRPQPAADRTVDVLLALTVAWTGYVLVRPVL